MSQQHYEPEFKKKLVSQRFVSTDIILHSDQGSQYTSKAFTEFCEKNSWI